MNQSGLHRGRAARSQTFTRKDPMRTHTLLLILTGAFACQLPAEPSAPQGGLHIQKCESGVDDPAKGDESVKVTYGERIYHVRVLHPRVVEGPHFSTPFFWVSDKAGENYFESLLALRPHIGGLSWHSGNGYFFAEKNGPLRGFFLEDGFDNWDDRSSGLIFVHDGKHSTAWRWEYDDQPDGKKRGYHITSADDLAKPAPKELIQALTPVLELAEKEAGGWPGP